MKAIKTLLISLLLLPLSLCAQQPNNLDFEAASPADVPMGWKTSRLTQPKTLVKTPDGEGSSLYLTAPFTEFESGYAYQELAASGEVLLKYDITARLRTRGVEGDGAQIYAYGKSSGSVLGYVQSESLRGDNDWTEVSLSLVTDSRMDSIRIGCYLGGTGEAWFDDLTFTRGEFSKQRMSKTARKYLREFFATVEPIALDRDEKPWKELKSVARMLASGAQTTADVYPAMRYTLGRINKHSFMFEPAVAADLNGSDLATDEVDPDLKYTSGRRINDRIAYLSMPAMGSGHQATLNAFADSLQGLMAALETETTTGWVLDLRENGGGNCWPMLAGVGPLIGEGIAGYFQERDGSNASPWVYRDGKSFERGNERVTTRNHQLSHKQFRVAVLVGPQTASSGEITAIAFMGLPYARLFGQPSAGYVTTNTSIPMSDGAMVMVTISIYGDRNKRAVEDRVVPDVIVAPEAEKDAALEAAIEWLEGEI
ncbi:S41 family peptidase [Lewinella sp. W8]|uniref:S41 family peptidase n=1 Tax=Lewinella sp. W8 TaxID=2528208 RepID=UPI001566A4A0|nr:S41 family peptidase [Lewinella sp. W8]